MEDAQAGAAGAAHALERVLTQVAGRTLADPVESVPGVERVRAVAHRLEPRRGIDEVVDVARIATEVLRRQADTRVARQHPGTVTQAGGIGRSPAVAPAVDHRARQLGVVRPRAAVEVVGARRHPDVVDDADLGVHVDGRALLVLEVVHRDPIVADLVQRVEHAFATDPARLARERAVRVGEARDDRHDVELGVVRERVAQRLGGGE